jgi:HK97 family phage portal protein
VINFVKNLFKSSDSSQGGGNWIPLNLMHSFFGGQSKAGIHINEHTALFNSAVFACNRAISESIAMLPRDLFEQKGSIKVDVQGHPVKKILTREANPIQTSYKFFETLQHHVLSSGNGYAEIQRKRGGGDVVALWPLPPEKVQPECVTNEAGELDIVYHVTLKTGERKTLAKESVLHIPGLGYDGLVGYPVIQFMLHAIGLGQALEEYGSLFFKQGAGLPGYVSVPDNFDDNQIKNLKKHYSILNEGLENAHRFKFLYESSKFTPSSATPDQSQMLQSRVFQVQEVARFYRMPLHKIQEVSNKPSYNSLEQFNIEFVNDTLMPPITNWEQELNRKLFLEAKDENKYIKFNVNAILRGDLRARALFYRTLVMSGIMSRNEARALEDLPPAEGGDELMTPLNMRGLSEREDDARERIQD